MSIWYGISTQESSISLGLVYKPRLDMKYHSGKKNNNSGPPAPSHPLIRLPRYYCHFILAQNKAQSVILLFKEPLEYGYPVNTARFLWPVDDRINWVPLY